MTTKIYILLPVRNRKKMTHRFVECLMKQTFSNYHLLLIDDGSTDNTSEMVKERIPSTTVLCGPGNWWWAGSLQQGLEWLKKKEVDENAIVLFINDDVTFLPDYLERAVRLMAEKKRVLMLSRFRSLDDSQIMETGVCADLRRLSFRIADHANQINCLSTRGLFIHWRDVVLIGGFHPKLLPHYLSDYEYTIRAHRKGFKCETSAELLIVPDHEATGYHVIADRHFAAFIKKYFSKKSAGNPLYWSSFVLLTSRPIWIFPNLLRIWIRSIIKIAATLNEIINLQWYRKIV